MPLHSHPNPDLAVGADRHPRWNSAPYRRQGFHNLQTIARYAQSSRAARVLDLRLSADLSIPAREDVRHLTALPWFSAMAVTEGNRLLFEAYARDFGPDRPHSIMSISKMAANLVLGRLWEDGKLAMEETLGQVLPWIGPGYHGATVEDVANMNVRNAYDEDYHNPDTTPSCTRPPWACACPRGRSRQTAISWRGSAWPRARSTATTRPAHACTKAPTRMC